MRGDAVRHVAIVVLYGFVPEDQAVESRDEQHFCRRFTNFIPEFGRLFRQHFEEPPRITLIRRQVERRGLRLAAKFETVAKFAIRPVLVAVTALLLFVVQARTPSLQEVEDLPTAVQQFSTSVG